MTPLRITSLSWGITWLANRSVEKEDNAASIIHLNDERVDSIGAILLMSNVTADDFERQNSLRRRRFTSVKWEHRQAYVRMGLNAATLIFIAATIQRSAKSRVSPHCDPQLLRAFGRHKTHILVSTRWHVACRHVVTAMRPLLKWSRFRRGDPPMETAAELLPRTR